MSELRRLQPLSPVRLNRLQTRPQVGRMTASREHACAAALLCALALAAPLARAQFSWPEVANQDALQRGEVCADRSVLPVRMQSKRIHSKCGQTHAPVQCCALLPWLGRFRASFAALSQRLCDGCNLDKTPTDRVKHRRSGETIG